jgi:RNA polymerase sigma factor (TIGR02999 family)
MTSPGALTQLLIDSSNGDDHARERMLPVVYDELRRIAAGYMSAERANHTLRLIDQRRVDWRNRAQFVGVAATMMRRILLNHARDRVAAKRGGKAERVSIDLAADAFAGPELEVIALHDALDRLTALDARKGQVVELKFFGGLTTAEIAEVMHLSVATIEREWSFSRAWLTDALSGPAQDPGA